MNFALVFKKGRREDLGHYRPVSFTLIPEKVMEQKILENISKHNKSKKVIGVVNMDL